MSLFLVHGQLFKLIFQIKLSPQCCDSDGWVQIIFLVEVVRRMMGVLGVGGERQVLTILSDCLP